MKINKRAERFLLSIVANGYEDIAESFNETRKKNMKAMVYIIVENIKIKDGDRILDLGCGNGRFLDVLIKEKKEINYFYLGIDNSSKLINYAKNAYKQNFKIVNIVDLNKMKEDNFDYIFSWAVFHHLPGSKIRLKFLESVYKKIKTDGLFVFSVWKLRSRKDFFKLALTSFFNQLLKFRIINFGDLIFNWKGNKNGDQKARYYHAFSENSLKKLISKTSFKVEKFLEDDFNYYYILKK